MAKRIKYIGALDRYFELPITGKQSVWGRGDTDIREDAEADLLIATGDFTQVSDTSSISQATDPDIVAGTSTTPMLASPAQLKLAVETHGGGTNAQTLAYGASITADASAGNIMLLTLTGGCEITSITNMTITKPVEILVTQDATGDRPLIVENADFGSGLGGQKLSIVLRYDGTENRLMNSPVWS